MKIPHWVTLLSLLILPIMVQAIEEQQVGEKQHTVFGLYLTPFEAYNMKQQQGDKVLLIDVRSRAEIKFVGASDMMDANIPSRFFGNDFEWSNKSANYRTSYNANFVQDVEKLLAIKKMDKNTPIILMCQSGTRVPSAAEELHDAGFSKVYSQYQGFEGIKAKSGVNQGQRVVNGWKNAGLPWGFRMNKDGMYFNFDSSQNETAQ